MQNNFYLFPPSEKKVRAQQLIFCALKAWLLWLQEKTWSLSPSTLKTSEKVKCEG